MACSTFTLSLGAFFAVASGAFLGVAFFTNNWQEYRVSYDIGGFPQGETNAEINALYLNRTQGLFRYCFAGEKPDQTKVPTTATLAEENCMGINYHMGEVANGISDISHDEQIRLHIIRSKAAFFILAFVCLFLAFLVGFHGCWTSSPGKAGLCGLFLLIATCLSAFGIGFFHLTEYWENDKIKVMPFRGGWGDHIEDYTKSSFSWSYFVAMTGVAACLMSSLLLFGASVCLKSEKKREESKNMAYIMPVYQQKQQYANYGYGYPGPYQYNQQQQYGHYNY